MSTSTDIEKTHLIHVLYLTSYIHILRKKYSKIFICQFKICFLRDENCMYFPNVVLQHQACLHSELNSHYQIWMPRLTTVKCLYKFWGAGAVKNRCVLWTIIDWRDSHHQKLEIGVYGSGKWSKPAAAQFLKRNANEDSTLPPPQRMIDSLMLILSTPPCSSGRLHKFNWRTYVISQVQLIPRSVRYFLSSAFGFGRKAQGLVLPKFGLCSV